MTDASTTVITPCPAFATSRPSDDAVIAISRAVAAWLLKTPSPHTRRAYKSDLSQFFAHLGWPNETWHNLPSIRPEHVACWRDALFADEQSNSTIRRKMTALRSLFSYLQTYGYTGPNPAHSDFVEAPAVPRDGKTAGLSPADCRRLLDAPAVAGTEGRLIPIGVRDRALIAVLAYSACRVGELVKLRVRDYRTTGDFRILNITGKGGKERVAALHPEVVERVSAWIEVAGIGLEPSSPLFLPLQATGDRYCNRFRPDAMTTRAVEKLIRRYVLALSLDRNISVHSLRVTALTTARERGSDIIDLQEFAGHADPRTTLTYIRSRDRLSKSPAYAIKY